MKQYYSRNSIFSGILVILIACALVFSFGLHAVQISHDHPGNTSHHAAEKEGSTDVIVSLGDFMHMADKKFFLPITLTLLSIAALAILYGTWRVFMLLNERTYSFSLRRKQRTDDVVEYYLEYYFSRGILHPKSH